MGVHRDGDAACNKDRSTQCQNNELYKDLGAVLTSGFKTLDQQVNGQMLLGTVGIRRTQHSQPDQCETQDLFGVFAGIAQNKAGNDLPAADNDHRRHHEGKNGTQNLIQNFHLSVSSA